MKREKNNLINIEELANLDKPPRWRKKAHTGDHRLANGTIISDDKPFRAYPNELIGAMDKFVCLDTLPNNTIKSSPAATLIPVHKGNGVWTVVDINGKAFTDEDLTQQEAMGLINGGIYPTKETKKQDEIIIDENPEIEEEEEKPKMKNKSKRMKVAEEDGDE